MADNFGSYYTSSYLQGLMKNPKFAGLFDPNGANKEMLPISFRYGAGRNNASTDANNAAVGATAPQPNRLSFPQINIPQNAGPLTQGTALMSSLVGGLLRDNMRKNAPDLWKLLSGKAEVMPSAGSDAAKELMDTGIDPSAAISDVGKSALGESPLKFSFDGIDPWSAASTALPVVGNMVGGRYGGAAGNTVAGGAELAMAVPAFAANPVLGGFMALQGLMKMGKGIKGFF